MTRSMLWLMLVGGALCSLSATPAMAQFTNQEPEQTETAAAPASVQSATAPAADPQTGIAEAQPLPEVAPDVAAVAPEVAAVVAAPAPVAPAIGDQTLNGLAGKLLGGKRAQQVGAVAAVVQQMTAQGAPADPGASAAPSAGTLMPAARDLLGMFMKKQPK